MSKLPYLTISDACEKHGIKRSTLISWVKKGNVISEKRDVGNQLTHFIDELSLLEQMKTSSATFVNSTNETKRFSEIKGEPESIPIPPARLDQGNQKPQNSVPDKDDKTQPRERPRSNIAVTRAKNSMRAMNLESLVRVNTWLANRISEKSLNPRATS